MALKLCDFGVRINLKQNTKILSKLVKFRIMKKNYGAPTLGGVMRTFRAMVKQVVKHVILGSGLIY